MNKNISPDKTFCFGMSNMTNMASLDIDQAETPVNKELAEALLMVEDVLTHCKESPGKLASPEFAASLKRISTDSPEDFLAVRVRIKQQKPSGVLMSFIDDLTGEGEREGGDTAAQLIDIAKDAGKLFFDPETEQGYITVRENGISQTMAINSKVFINWISYQFYSATGNSASEQAIKQSSFSLSGIAKFDGEQRSVYLRVADHNDGHYIFLANDAWQAVEVMPTGWRLVNDPPVKFWKPSSMQALPMPAVGGDLNLLWRFINIKEEDRPLLLAWMIEAFRTETPKPILALSGTQGTAKSSTQDKIRQLIDNNAVNLRSAPKSVQDVFVSAGRSWLMSFENVSHISAQIQDTLCTLATGGGFASRTLYSDDDETVIEAKRPTIINSIPHVITAQDLMDRAISLELPSLVGGYRTESELEKEWREALPFIFGGLLDLFVKALKQLPKVRLENPPRMADFARLGEAMMQSQGAGAGVFTDLFCVNRNEGVTRALESSPAAVAIVEMAGGCAEGSEVFFGTAQNLLNSLFAYRHDTENWPRSARGLTDILRRQQAALSLLGIAVDISATRQRIGEGRGYPISIKNLSGHVGHVGHVETESLAGKKVFPSVLDDLPDLSSGEPRYH